MCKVTNQLNALTDGKAIITSISEKDWSSSTFDGIKYITKVRFEGSDVHVDADRFIELAPNHEFSFKNQVVVKSAITNVHSQVLPTPFTEVSLELSLLNVVN